VHSATVIKLNRRQRHRGSCTVISFSYYQETGAIIVLIIGQSA
jgi:hypothetical protein